MVNIVDAIRFKMEYNISVEVFIHIIKLNRNIKYLTIAKKGLCVCYGWFHLHELDRAARNAKQAKTAKRKQSCKLYNSDPRSSD